MRDENWLDRWLPDIAARATHGPPLEAALIRNIPDYAQMSEDDMKAWWEQAAEMPEDLFPPE